MKIKILFVSILTFALFQNASALTYLEIFNAQKGTVLGTSSGGSITLNPNPIKICDGSTVVAVSLTANAGVNYDVRIGSASGDLFARQAGNSQTVKETGNWVTNGMVFYLINTATGEVLGSETAVFSADGCANSLTTSSNPVQVCSGTTAEVLITANASVAYEIRVNSPSGDLFATQAGNTPVSKMTGKWVTDGMQFFLVKANTQTVLSELKINFTTTGCPSSISVNPSVIKACFSSSAEAKITAWAPVDYEVRVSSPSGDLFAKKLANTKLEQASGKWITNGLKFFVINSATKETLAQTTAVVSSEGCDFSNEQSEFNSLKSITWYEFGVSIPQTLKNLQGELPRIKQTGFNSVWLVLPWAEMNPKPLSNPPVYNYENFTALRETLEFFRSNGMKVIIGLNYLGNGWSPEGIDYCNWITKPEQYKAFINYSSEFLRIIKGFSEVANILVFTENAEPCNLNAYSNAIEISKLLKATLGNFPNQLPSDIRSRFKIGYHDYNQINLGWAQGNSPVADPNPFDFMSMVGYDLEEKTDLEINSEINLRASRFKALFPDKPLILGEFGARACSQDKDNNQTRVITAIIQRAVTNKYGFNLWGWKKVSTDECSRQLSGYGLAILDFDNNPKPVAHRVSNLLNGSIANVIIARTSAPRLPTSTPTTEILKINSTSTPATTTPSVLVKEDANKTLPEALPAPKTESTNVYPYPSASLVNDKGTVYFISGRNKIPFTNFQAFIGLGYLIRNIEVGDLSAYIPAQTYKIFTSEAGHPWGSWLYYKGTVYYAHESGLIGVPTYSIFLNNGGEIKYIVRANKYDIEILDSNPEILPLKEDDERIYR